MPSQSDSKIETVAGNLQTGDIFYGAVGRRARYNQGLRITVSRTLQGRVLVDFGNGITRRYEPGRRVVIGG